MSGRMGIYSQAAGGEVKFLDAYSGAGAAYSLESLSNSTTNVIKARRSSDNAELDFTALDITDGTLTTWTGANDGFVTTIYDQVNSNNMTQTTSSKQGKIVSSGSVITLGGKACIERSTSDYGGYISTYDPNDGAAVKGMYYVGDNNSKRGTIFGSLSGVRDYGFFVTLGSSNAKVDDRPTITASKINGLTNAPATRGESYTATDKHFLMYREIEFNFQYASLALGYRFTSVSSFGMLTFQEMVIFLNTTDSAAKQANINSRYSIY